MTDIELLSETPWFYALLDSSRIAIFIISVSLIVYGSFRSLNYDACIKKEEKQIDAQVINGRQAFLFPLVGSIFLLVSFFFFDSLQLLFFVCTSVVVTITCAFLLLPFVQSLIRPFFDDAHKISIGIVGRYTAAEVVSVFISLGLVFLWIITGHWLLMDALAMGLCVAFIALIRLPSLKVSTLLLTGLLLYDVFWVFFSTYIFNTNVMVYVATKTAENPISYLSKNVPFISTNSEPPKLSLPAKLMFPSFQDVGRFSMLGLGDIVSYSIITYSLSSPSVSSTTIMNIIIFNMSFQVMPGLLLCFVMRYDAHKRTQNGANNNHSPSTPVSSLQKVTYFHCSLIGYFLGLLTATVSAEFFKAAQPALLYLVPFTLLPLMIMAYLKGDLRRMWNEPFTDYSSSVSSKLDKTSEIYV
ncbi:Signal peptide peptidase-like 3 [Trichinella britovi]|uniref:Signal peptide peptidase-like 3 n=1 Tax=Trichinella britovi TaxID=45882 RepID=A0A0V1CF31_TRIBR|nr:Signal peptide peptidase-like 3 [Trichinella britovi]